MAETVLYNIYVDDKNDRHLGRTKSQISKLISDVRIHSNLKANSNLGSELYAANILSWVAIDVQKESLFLKRYGELKSKYSKIFNLKKSVELKGQNIDLGDGLYKSFYDSKKLTGYYFDLFRLLDKFSVKYGLMVYDYIFNEYFRPRFHNDAAYMNVFLDYELYSTLGRIYYASFSNNLKLEAQNINHIDNVAFWKEFEKVYSEANWSIFNYRVKSKVYSVIKRELRYAKSGKSNSQNQFWDDSESKLFTYNSLVESVSNQIPDGKINEIYYDEGIFNGLESLEEFSKSTHKLKINKVDSKSNLGVQLADVIVSISAVGLKKVQDLEQLYSNGYLKESLFLFDNLAIWDGVFASDSNRKRQYRISYVFSKFDIILS